jgi:DNA-binding GntR family transcriptional regulator
MMLLLVLASRKYKDRPIRVYWEELADDLGVGRDTVRKWAYELEKQKLLKIKRKRSREPEDNRLGFRNDRNVFDLTPFVSVVREAWLEKKRQSKLRRQGEDDE